MALTHDDIYGLLNLHEHLRYQSLNLIASENRLSPAVRGALNSDLIQRYGDYNGRDPAARKYRGNRYLQTLEEGVTDLATQVFGASEVELRAISGHVAGAGVVMGLAKPGDVVLEIGSDGGGHRLASKLCYAKLISLDVQFLPFSGARFNLDLQRTCDMIRRVQPRLVIIGSSAFLFPHPVRALAEVTRALPDTLLVYDASHVLGLIAAGRFQDPLREGAQVMFGSTHKTFPGPQGGLIVSNDRMLMDQISRAVYPAIVTNHHPFRIPALGLALLEMLQWGGAYADQIIANAQALASELKQLGVPVLTFDHQSTLSHTLLLEVGQFGTGVDVAARLEAANIITTSMHLPTERGGEGIRVGVQEVTRLGMREAEMAEVADCITSVVRGERTPQEITPRVAELSGSFQMIHYTWML